VVLGGARSPAVRRPAGRPRRELGWARPEQVRQLLAGSTSGSGSWPAAPSPGTGSGSARASSGSGSWPAAGSTPDARTLQLPPTAPPPTPAPTPPSTGAGPATHAAASSPGLRRGLDLGVPHLEVVRKLAEGGMGAVCLAAARPSETTDSLTDGP